MTVAIFFFRGGKGCCVPVHLARNFRSGNKHVRMRVDELGLFLITAPGYSNVSSVSLVISFVILFPIYLFIIYYENRNSYDAISGDEEIEHTKKRKNAFNTHIPNLLRIPGRTNRWPEMEKMDREIRVPTLHSGRGQRQKEKGHAHNVCW